MRRYVLGCLARARGGCPLEKQNAKTAHQATRSRSLRQGDAARLASGTEARQGRSRVRVRFTTARPRRARGRALEGLCEGNHIRFYATGNKGFDRDLRVAEFC